MSARQRGLIVFGGILFVAIVFCGLFPFVIMPGLGLGVALPVIEVPGEVVVENFLPGFNLTNSIIGTILTDLVLVLIVVILWRKSKGWTREVPGRMQGAFEAFTEGFRNFFAGIAGDRLRTTPLLWPLVATIFLFLLTANYLKLLPGAETVGKMHCAHVNKKGFAMHPGYWTDNSYYLWVDEPLNAGFTQTLEAEHACEAYFKYGQIPRDGFPVESVEQIEEHEAAFAALLDQLPSDEDILAQAEADALAAVDDGEIDEDEVESFVQERVHELEAERDEAYLALVAEEEGFLQGTDYKYAYYYVYYAHHRLENAENIEALEAQIAELETEIEALSGDHAEEDAAAHGEENAETEAVAAEDEAHAAEAVLIQNEEVHNEDLVSALQSEIDALEDELMHQQTQLRYPEAPLAFSQEDLDAGVKPYIFHITPFVRGPATDLSLTFALAIISIVAVQIYGVMALGPAYFDKFLNIPALGNLGKKPLGAIDFVVGLIEIISEIGKIISLAFRLFGNLFAGGVALMAVTFLVAWLVPGVIYGLELIIGAVQALVFAVLTLVFSVQAMEHHGDHEEEHH
ncbi:MAG: hypothetical protein CUN56_02260 [Phototrophicales bacterium]|nr:MAG: hypothetical protein CUN56_02260 [Phototrophicales bacterium]RMG77822.1 MAG: hypothetical protein D6711_00590 [Chloroflexota bacterium]